jgi:hypothetical protein
MSLVLGEGDTPTENLIVGLGKFPFADIIMFYTLQAVTGSLLGVQYPPWLKDNFEFQKSNPYHAVTYQTLSATQRIVWMYSGTTNTFYCVPSTLSDNIFLFDSTTPVTLKNTFFSCGGIVSYKGSVYALLDSSIAQIVSLKLESGSIVTTIIASVSKYGTFQGYPDITDFAIDQATGDFYVAFKSKGVFKVLPNGNLDRVSIPDSSNASRISVNNGVVYYVNTDKRAFLHHPGNSDTEIAAGGGVWDVAYKLGTVQLSNQLATDYESLVRARPYDQLCPGVPFCSGNGTCDTFAQCTCGVGYAGADCSFACACPSCPPKTCPGDGTCGNFGSCENGECICEPGHYGADCTGCQKPPVQGCFADVSWPFCEPDESILECSPEVTANPDVACCLTESGEAEDVRCPDGWSSTDYCVSDFNVFGAEQIRRKCNREC